LAERPRVAIDARRFQDRPLGGVGRAIQGTLDAIASEVDVVLLTDARRDPAPTELPQVALSVPRGAPEIAWLQQSLVSWLRTFDGVFHGTFNALPLRLPVPGVVTIHDLSFEIHPEDFGRAKRRVFQIQARHAARVARCLIAPSEHVKGELIEHYRLPADRVLVTPWGVEPRFSPDAAGDPAALCDRLGVVRPYVLAMGGARRRGLEVSLEAHRRARAAGLDATLVVVGPEQPPSSAGVVHAGVVDDREWAGLLAGATAFCYPTRYEGFGVPALEAMSSGTPVVCARTCSLPEILGDAAEWCEAPTPGPIADGLCRLAADPERTATLRAAGLDRAARHPTWEDAAATTLRAYREAQR
jgi:glycosyltransferase involved in cell wall biosynthesis